jgi:hypothetical protein
MSVLPRCCALVLAMLLGALTAHAQTGPANHHWAFRCDADKPGDEFDRDRPQYLWSAKELLPESNSRPGALKINVYLKDPTAEEIRIVDKAMMLWTTDKAASGIIFEMVLDPKKSHIRIWFEGDRVWSAIGTRALRIPVDEPTMRLPRPGLHEWMALHAFGHVLGLTHEYLDARGFSGWRVSTIFSDYWKKGWCERTSSIDRDITTCLEQIEREVTLSSRTGHYCPGGKTYAPDSVMVYPIGEDWLVRRPTSRREIKLLDHENACVQRLYPGARPGQGEQASFFPPLRQMYRLCRANNVSSCEGIYVTGNGNELVFRSGEAGKALEWVWVQQGAKYELKTVRRVVSGETLSRVTSRLVPAGGFYDGDLLNMPDCGNAYIRITAKCPDDLRTDRADADRRN